MKLNPDCVRDIMMVLEEITGIRIDCGIYFKGVDYRSLSQRQDLSGLYSREEIIYTLIQLSESGYIDMKYSADNDRLSISMGNILYVTPKGHEFVANLKDKDRWNEKIKPIASSLGTISLAIIESIASGVTSAAIEKLMIGQ